MLNGDSHRPLVSQPSTLSPASSTTNVAKAVAPAGKGSAAAKKPPQKMVPYSKLFRFADWVDILLMCTACLFAAANGIIFPMFT
jgi:hypothetical protein